MSDHVWPRGLMPALVTPLAGDHIALDVMAELVERQIDEGVSGLVVGGGTGEYGSLTIDERTRLAAHVIAKASGRLPVVVQTGALATRDAIELSRQAEGAGAAGILVASPFGEPISWHERLRFYEDLTACVTLPVMIYNTPPSGILSLRQIQSLAQLPNVSAVKDSSGDHQLMGDLVEWASGTDFAVYVGADSFVYDAISAGARGAVIGLASFAPGLIAGAIRAVQDDGPSPESHAAWVKIRPLLRFMEKSSNYISMCKVGCQLRGLDVGDVRSPYLMPADDEIDSLRGILKELDLPSWAR